MDPKIATNLLQLILNLYETFKELHKDKSEKFEKMWDKDFPELVEAVRDGDIEKIKIITAKYYEL